MRFFVLAGLINGLSATFLGLFVFSRNPKDIRHKTYGLFCLCLSVWSYAYFRWLLTGSSHSAVFWTRLLMAGAIFIPPTAFHHLMRLLGRKVSRGFLAGNYAVSTGLALADLGPWVVADVRPAGPFPYWPVPGPLFHLHLIQFAMLAVLGLWALREELAVSDGLRRNQLKFLILAEIVGWAGGLTNYPLWYNIPILPYGNILVSVYTVIFAYAMVRYRLLEIEIIIKKSLVYAFLLLVMLIPCYLLVIWTQLEFFGEVSASFSLITLLLLTVVGFLFPKLRFRTEEAFERVLFRKRNDYRTALLSSSRDLVSMMDLQAICDSTVQTIGKALGVDKVALYLFDETKGSFDLKTGVGLSAGEFGRSALSRENLLVQRLIRRPETVIREELGMAPRGEDEAELARAMAAVEAEVSLPLMSKEKLIGILNLGHKEARGMYSKEDLEVLSALANQAAIAIENARLYENLKQSQSIIRRADRLSSLGMLTAGLAHEIRNPLVAIRTFTQLLPERYQEPEFRNDFQVLALKEVDRICGLINDLLNFARPSKPNVSAENLNEIVEGIVRILESEAKEKEVQITRRLASNLPKIFIDKEQIKQVSMNIILNALQSIEGRGAVEVSTRLLVKNGSEHYVQIEVRDSGVGIPEKDLENIFNPFFTTRKDGSGLGLSISHQIVQEHGGYIVVESQVGKGTAFFIHLPVGQPNQQEGRDLPGAHEKDSGC